MRQATISAIALAIIAVGVITLIIILVVGRSTDCDCEERNEMTTTTEATNEELPLDPIERCNELVYQRRYEEWGREVENGNCSFTPTIVEFPVVGEVERYNIEVDPSTFTSEEFCEKAGFTWSDTELSCLYLPDTREECEKRGYTWRAWAFSWNENAGAWNENAGTCEFE